MTALCVDVVVMEAIADVVAALPLVLPGLFIMEMWPEGSHTTNRSCYDCVTGACCGLRGHTRPTGPVMTV
jgi:hypothetical protein